MKWVVILLSCFICGSALAEMRLWEDKKGNSLEAEYQCMVMGKVVLRDRKGKDHKLSLSSLSEKDQKFLQTKLPPDINIEFKKWQDRKTRYSSSTVEMRGEITLTKTSRLPYEAGLKAILFMIGEDSYEDEYIMMDRAEFTFDFKKEKEHTFEGEKFKMHQDKDAYDNDDGVEYRGYLVIIYDAGGEVMLVKASSAELEKNAPYLSEIKRGSRFSDKMKGKVKKGSSSSTYY